MHLDERPATKTAVKCAIGTRKRARARALSGRAHTHRPCYVSDVGALPTARCRAGARRLSIGTPDGGGNSGPADETSPRGAAGRGESANGGARRGRAEPVPSSSSSGSESIDQPDGDVRAGAEERPQRRRHFETFVRFQLEVLKQLSNRKTSEIRPLPSEHFFC